MQQENINRSWEYSAFPNDDELQVSAARARVTIRDARNSVSSSEIFGGPNIHQLGFKDLLTQTILYVLICKFH